MTFGNMVGDHGSEWAHFNSPAIESRYTAIAGEDIPAGVFASVPLTDVRNIFLHESKFYASFGSIKTHKIMFQGNRLYSEDLPIQSLIASLPLAEDVHTEVASLSVSPDPILPAKASVILTVNKLVKKGEPFSIWFSSQLASDLGLPFLTFSHIKEGKYVCSDCDRNFLAPNPLKLHLATSCNTVKSDDLWSRVLKSLTPKNNSLQFPLFYQGSKTDLNFGHIFSCNRKHFSSITKPFLPFTFSSSSLKNDDSKDAEPESLKPHAFDNINREIASESKNLDRDVKERSNISRHHGSAFKPVSSNSYKNTQNLKVQMDPTYSQLRKCLSNSNNALISTPYSSVSFLSSFARSHISPMQISTSAVPEIPDWQNLYRNPSLSTVLNSRLVEPSHSSINSLPSTSASDPCAEVETLVSNLGRGKGSHLCLYCGKVYSRKYGLKIHIRTHTGYKPLKCRICFRPFGDPSNLNKHVRLHAQGGTPYGCELCGKVLVRRRDLERHLRSRHPGVSARKNTINTNTLRDSTQKSTFPSSSSSFSSFSEEEKNKVITKKELTKEEEIKKEETKKEN